MTKDQLESVSGTALAAAIPGWIIASSTGSTVAAGLFSVIAWMSLIFLISAMVRKG